MPTFYLPVELSTPQSCDDCRCRDGGACHVKVKHEWLKQNAELNYIRPADCPLIKSISSIDSFFIELHKKNETMIRDLGIPPSMLNNDPLKKGF